MTRDELEKRNVGENLDALMNLDPRGYGVCRILYAGSRAYTGEPLTMHAAQVLCDTVKENDLVYIITGFVLLPHKVPEMDGTVSAMLLARALVMAFGAKPVIVCPDDSVQAIEKCAAVVGLHIYEDLDTVQALPLSMGVVAFTKDIAAAPAQATELAVRKPAAVVSVEACGANAVGVCHNAVGLDVTALQARSDVLWDTLRANGVPNIAIGDLGNEIGMGTIAEHIKKYVPFTAEGECQCGCGGGILSATKADNIITATCSDWGCNALMAATAFMLGKPELFHSKEDQATAMDAAAGAGMLDMYGEPRPYIDGIGKNINLPLVSMMKALIEYPPTVEDKTEAWFENTLRKGFFTK